MSLYDNNALLKILSGGRYAPTSGTTSDEEKDAMRAYGEQLLKTELPQMIYSPWQGVGAALNRFMGRQNLDFAANLDKQARAAALGHMKETTSAAIDPMMQAAEAAREALKTKYVKPKVSPILKQGGMTTASIDTPNVEDGALNQTPPSNILSVYKSAKGGEDITLPPTEEAPDGYTLSGTLNTDTNEFTPVGTQVASLDNTGLQADPKALEPMVAPVAREAPTQVNYDPQQEVADAIATPTAYSDQPDQATKLNPSGPGAYTDQLLPQEPPLSSQELVDQNILLDPTAGDRILAERKRLFTPTETKADLGTYRQTPIGATGFTNEPKYETFNAGGVQLPTRVSRDAQGKATNEFFLPGGGSTANIKEAIADWREFDRTQKAKDVEATTAAGEMTSNYVKQAEAIKTVGFKAETEALPLLKIQKNILEGKDIFTGFGGDEIAQANNFLATMGLKDTDRATAAQAFKKLNASDILRNIMSLGGQGLGQVRVKEMDIIEDMSQSLNLTKEANLFVNEIGQRLLRKLIKLNEMSLEYRMDHQGRLDIGWDRKVMNYFKEHPFISKEEELHWGKLKGTTTKFKGTLGPEDGSGIPEGLPVQESPAQTPKSKKIYFDKNGNPTFNKP